MAWKSLKKGLGLQKKATPTPPPVEQNITTENLFANLSAEQKKDLLLNNPNIYTPEGSQIYDPLTNSIRLNESDFTKAERLRQESLASQLSSSLSGDFSNNGQAIQDATFQRGKAQIDPIVKQQKRDLAQQLADQGIPAGSEQYNEAMNRLDDSVARQYTDLSQASIATGEQVRQSRFNEISSLLGRSQVGAGTSFGGYQPNYNGIDLAGFAQQSQMQNQQLSFLGTQAQKDRNARTNALSARLVLWWCCYWSAKRNFFGHNFIRQCFRQAELLFMNLTTKTNHTGNLDILA
jgi:hypothetical protein